LKKRFAYNHIGQTGKELAARAVHYLTSRTPFLFVAVNRACLTETLLEDELFGHA
jgi:transcriptional regulator with GAF, ATPase, and Fis domain